MHSLPSRSWVEISGEVIADNFRRIRHLVGPGVGVVPVVKANAYGHGARDTARTLERCGATGFAVATVEEGIELRQAGIGGWVLVMGDFLACEQGALSEFRLTPVLHSAGQVLEWEAFCKNSQLRLPFHLDIDTGMGRLGAHPDALVLDAVCAARWGRFEGLMTHLAAAGNFASGQTASQLEKFEECRVVLKERGALPEFLHMASSVAVAYGIRSSWGSLVRPGLALYGYVNSTVGPAPECLLRLRPALSWKARILEIKEVPAGSLIGYDGSFRTSRLTRMAVIAVGYADGVRWALSNRGRVLAGGAWAPLIGAVSMDVSMIDITGCGPLERGDAVTLLGTEGTLTLDAAAIASAAGTVTHDILSGIGRRVKRVFSSD